MTDPQSRDENAFDGYVLEASWEVCNKVGGIYTVVSSKVKHMLNRYGDSYLTIGPYVAEKAATGFSRSTRPNRSSRSSKRSIARASSARTDCGT